MDFHGAIKNNKNKFGRLNCKNYDWQRHFNPGK